MIIATPVLQSKRSKSYKPSPSKVINDHRKKYSGYESLDSYLEFLQRTEEYSIVDRTMDKQLYITEGMRAILVDWMCELCYNYSLHRITYHLAVILLDRYMATVR